MSFHGARSRLVRVGVVASSGYIGGELLRLLLQHPQVDLTVATSRSYAGEYVKYIPQLAKTGLKIVDMSADFRLKDPSKYKSWYGFDHPSPDLLRKFVYAIPEINREEVRAATLVSSPGCMAITSILALAPLLKQRSFPIDPEHIIVDAKIGSSGAGGKPSLS